MTLRPPIPQALDVVPASEVNDLLARTDREFVDIETRVTGLRAEAEEAEALAASEGVDPSSSTWTMVRLQRFLAELRDEAQRDAEAVVEVARQRARVRVADAHMTGPAYAADAPPFASGRTTAAGSPPASVSPFAPPEPAPPLSNGALGNSTSFSMRPTAPASDPPAGGAPPAVAPLPLSADPAPSMNGATNLVDDPWNAPDASTEISKITNLAPIVMPPVIAPAPQPAADTAPHVLPAPAPSDPLFPPATAAEAAVVTAATLVPAAPAAPAAFVSAPAPATAKDAKKAEKQARKAADAKAKAQRTAGATPKPGLLKRLPVTAILEVFAVLLILVFILIRLS